MVDFQFMPEHDEDSLAALREDIRANGIQVPIVQDQHDRILDGHHRRRIADELGIPCPAETVHVADDEDAANRSIALNMLRRHMSREQRRAVIAARLKAAPEKSNVQHAKALGVSDNTVRAVRQELESTSQIARLETTVGADGKARRASMSVLPAEPLTEAQAREISERIIVMMSTLENDIVALFFHVASNGVDFFEVFRALDAGQRSLRTDGPEAVGEFFAGQLERLYGHLVQTLLDPEVRAMFERDAAGPHFAPLDDATVSELLYTLANPLPKIES